MHHKKKTFQSSVPQSVPWSSSVSHVAVITPDVYNLERALVSFDGDGHGLLTQSRHQSLLAICVRKMTKLGGPCRILSDHFRNTFWKKNNNCVFLEFLARLSKCVKNIQQHRRNGHGHPARTEFKNPRSAENEKAGCHRFDYDSGARRFWVLSGAS